MYVISFFLVFLERNLFFRVCRIHLDSSVSKSVFNPYNPVHRPIVFLCCPFLVIVYVEVCPLPFIVSFFTMENGTPMANLICFSRRNTPPQAVRKPIYHSHFGHKNIRIFRLYLSVYSYLTSKTE